MISKQNIYALVGASNNPEKYGFKIFTDLTEAGYNVVPINPRGGIMSDLKVYPSLSDYPNSIDVVVFVVPPQVTEEVLKEVNQLGLKKVWMQPGSDSEKAIKFCEDNNIECIHHSCIMVEHKKI